MRIHAAATLGQLFWSDSWNGTVEGVQKAGGHRRSGGRSGRWSDLCSGAGTAAGAATVTAFQRLDRDVRIIPWRGGKPPGSKAP